jgi:integral membrane sensor domain MASE1
MTDTPKQARSPAPKWLKAAIGGAYILVWLVVIIIDWYRGTNSVPAWYQATGLIVLGYLLGINLEDLRQGGGER